VAEDIYYIAEAQLWKVEGPHEYTLWFINHGDDATVRAWRNGTYDPTKTNELINVRLDQTADAVAPHVYDKTPGALIATLDDDPLGKNRRGRVALHESLWNKIPALKRPLPPVKDPLDRIKLVRANDKKIYFGVHAQVLADGEDDIRLAFYSANDTLLADQWVARSEWTSDNLHPTHTKLKPTNKVGETGALFAQPKILKDWFGVSTESEAVGRLIIKVPWGAQN